MTVEALAALVIDACESEGVEHMVTGAFAVSFYGIPRSTKDVDVVISLSGGSAIERIVARLDPIVADLCLYIVTLDAGFLQERRHFRRGHRQAEQREK